MVGDEKWSEGEEIEEIEDCGPISVTHIPYCSYVTSILVYVSVGAYLSHPSAILENVSV